MVDTPSVAKRTGLTGKRTKATRRAAASDATSPGNNGAMKLPTKSEDRDQKTEKSSQSQSTKAATTANKTGSRDQKKTENFGATVEQGGNSCKQKTGKYEEPSELCVTSHDFM